MANAVLRRRLSTQIDADEFVKKVMDIPDDDGRLAAKIVCAELGLKVLEDYPTSRYEDFRVAKYRSDEDRQELQQKILKELILMPRLKDDDMIEPGHGGARPDSLAHEAQAYIVSGPPASGKSTITNALASKMGAYVLDSDYAKRKFPEYQFYEGGASLVHEEADLIIFGPEKEDLLSEKEHLLEYCAYNYCNMVIPLIGRTDKSMKEICERLIDSGYTIHVINVVLSPDKCVSRAFKRYLDTKRYVPLSYIFDEVGTNPERIYFHLKREYDGHPNFGSFMQLSTDTAPPKIIECIGNSPYSPSTIIKECLK